MSRIRTACSWIVLLASTATAQAPGSDLAKIYRTLEARRAENLDRLHRYAIAGRFPRNTDFPDERTPYFVDRFGTRCAVGELMHLAGREADVLGIARANNQVRVMDVRDGVLVDWVVDSGLTQQECARIQPTYEFYFRIAEKERARIQKHLLTVEAELRKRTQASLAKALRVALDREIDAGQLTAQHAEQLLEALGHEEPNVRIGAAHALAKLRVPATKALLARLADGNREVRFWSAAALLEMLPIPRDAGPFRKLLPIFVDTLKNGTQAQRQLAVGRIGELARGLRMVPGDRAILREVRAALELPKEAPKDLRHLASWMRAIANPGGSSLDHTAGFNVGRIFLELQAGYPVHAAALHLEKNQLLKLLAKTPKCLDTRNRWGQTPLHVAAQTPWTQVETLEKHKADLTARSKAGCIPLHKANGFMDGDVKARDAIFGWTPLHYAAHRGNVRAVQNLLDNGADPDAKDRHGFTPLHLVAGCSTPGPDPIDFGVRKNWVVARRLIEGGADATVEDAKGRTPLWWAKHRKRFDVAREIGSKGRK